MNTLSLMIYVAEVVGRVGVGLTIIGTLAICGAGIFMFISALNADDGSAKPGTWKGGFWGVGIGLFLMSISAFVPPASTVYMIAASEAGEQVIKTPEAREMFEALRLRIMDELKAKVK